MKQSKNNREICVHKVSEEVLNEIDFINRKMFNNYRELNRSSN